MNFLNKFKKSMQKDVEQFQQVNNELSLKTKVMLYVISIVLLVVVMASIIFIKDYRITAGIALVFLGVFFFLSYFKKNKSRF